MHRLAATPGGWNPQSEGVIFIEQTPAPIVFLTAADTDIQTLAASISQLPPGFPALRVVNLLQLQQQLAIDSYAENVLAFAQIIILRLLGGRSYWSYGLEVIQEIVQQTGAALVVLPGDDRPDPDLIEQSTIALTAVNQLWRYFTEGGVANFANALQFLADVCLGQNYNPPPPEPVPRVGLYAWGRGQGGLLEASFSSQSEISTPLPPLNKGGNRRSKIGLLFYRAHYLAGNLAPIDALCQELAEHQLEPVPLFVSSVRDIEVQEELLSYFQPKDTEGIELLLNTTSFALARLDTETPQLEFWQRLDVPVLQVILSGGTVEQWETQFQGLTPRDTAMNVALPEVDGRIISRAVSFKSVQTWNSQLETDVVIYEPVRDRISFVAELAANWVKLRQTPPNERRIALILANYPNRDGRIANGVGLDTPASCIEILQALQQAGYRVEDIPENGDELIQRLTTGVTNDPEGRELRSIRQQLSGEEYQEYFESLPLEVQKGICDRWGVREHVTLASPHPKSLSHGERDFEILLPFSLWEKGLGDEGKGLMCKPDTLPSFPISGIQLGNVFVGIQPSRGYDIDPSLNYHAPDLEPTPAYLAFYYWLRQQFGAQAMVHVGKHGNLEWLPGKSLALSSGCYPEVALGAMPHLYPFIVNDPGEGSQAKRRAQAVIIDHLTPPMTRAELYGPLQQLEGLIDEYYEAQSLDPTRLPMICDRITQLIYQENLHQDLGIDSPIACFQASPSDSDPPKSPLKRGTLTEFSPLIKGGWGGSPGLKTHPNSPDQGGDEIQTFLARADGYLCELKEAQIRDGLHIFGQCPQGRQLRDLIVAIARHPGYGRMGLTRALAQDWGLDFDPLTADLSVVSGEVWEHVTMRSPHPKSLSHGERDFEVLLPKVCRTIGDIVEVLEECAAELVEQLIVPDNKQRTIDKGQRTQQELDWIRDRLLPALQQTNQELIQLLRGLDGRYVPSGPSGAPTRGRPEVLPTGRNFYSVDIRAIPTETAWDVGRKAAEVLIERYTQDHGEYPKTLGLSVWGTSTMRTGGDDIVEALALLGVQPVWDYPSRRVVDFEILPLSVLGRPRVDVTLRISGFFRDAFPNLISLVDQAVKAVAALDEPPEQNPLAWQVQQEQQEWEATGLSWEEAAARSHYRIFGSKPGAYGAGLQGLIESQNWVDEQDLARAYINWSSYAYTSSIPEACFQTSSSDLDPPKSPLKRGTLSELSPSNKQETKNILTPPLSKGGLGGVAAPEAFEQRLKQMQIVLHNQDNREHDLLDSDDYYQFQGGLTVAVRALTGKNPQTYFGDNSLPENPKVRQLREEIARVYRSRVINPKWIEGVMRHGYKGAFELSATVDYLFAYDATANCVEDHMYQGIAEAYLFNPTVQEFIEQKNPWALRDMAERLLEANQRGMWNEVEQQVLEKLRAIALEAEAVIENS